MIIDSNYPPEVAACQLAFELSTVAAGILTLHGRPVWFSSAFPEMLGYTPEEFKKQSAIDRIHPDDLPAFCQRVAAAAAGTPSLESAERRYRHKEGHYLWIHVSTNFIRNQAGDPTYILGIFQNINDRKIQEEKLQETKDQLNTILESVQDVIWSFSPELGRLAYMNENATRAVYQRTPEEFFQNPKLWMEVVHPDDRALAEALRLRLKQGAAHEQYRILRPSGEVRWVQTHTWTKKNSAGEPARIEGIVRDITEAKQAAIELEAKRQQLAAAAKMSALGEMAGGLAHEIINPLAIICGKASLLHQLAAQRELNQVLVQEAAETIENTSDRISRIVKSLRTFARDVTRDPFQRVPLVTIISETADLCRDRFHGSGIDFRISEVDPELDIFCRPVQISQVLLNMLNNAFDAVHDFPSPWIQISVIDDATHVKLCVTDMGRGVPPAIREKIFQPFFTTKDIGKGTGLGLSVSNGIIETHGGMLYLESSNPNTCFVARLPKQPTRPPGEADKQ